MSWTIDLPVDDLPDLPPPPRGMAERFADVVSRQTLQQPSWDARAIASVRCILESVPPTMTAPEVRKLCQEFADAAGGEAFLLQGSDYAETSESDTGLRICVNVRTLLQMAVVLTYGTPTPVVKMARTAGQYTKPRSRDTDGDDLLNYHGDMVSGIEPAREARVYDPARMAYAYASVSVAMNLVRVLTGLGTTGLYRLHKWNREFISSLPAGARYKDLTRETNHTLQFMAACGTVDLNLQTTRVYCSHEALAVNYERAMLRLPEDDDSQGLFNLSAHQLWIDERTHGVENSHISLVVMIGNPVGVKVDPATAPEEAVAYTDKPDLFSQPGRLTLTPHLGNDKVHSVLPPVVEAVEVSSHEVI